MKLKDLIPKLQALNPEAEVYVYGGWVHDSDGAQPLEGIKAAQVFSGSFIKYTYPGEEEATPSDTLIVLSE